MLTVYERSAPRLACVRRLIMRVVRAFLTAKLLSMCAPGLIDDVALFLNVASDVAVHGRELCEAAPPAGQREHADQACTGVHFMATRAAPEVNHLLTAQKAVFVHPSTDCCYQIFICMACRTASFTYAQIQSNISKLGVVIKLPMAHARCALCKTLSAMLLLHMVARRLKNVRAKPSPSDALALVERQYDADWDGRAAVAVFVRGDTPFPLVQRAWAEQGLAPRVLHTEWVNSGGGNDCRIYRMVRCT